MTVAAIIDMIIMQATIWAPAITALVGVIVLVINGINKIKAAAQEMKDDSSAKQLHTDLNQAHYDNQQLFEQNKLLIEQLSRIKTIDQLNRTNLGGKENGKN